MNEKEMISIIVPIYNTANYLEKCLNSIINQTYSNIEIILINNIACIETGIICNKYESLDNRIRVINASEISVGAARNIGIENAKGEYIGFVDSDDYIEKDMYEILLKEIKKNNADVATIGFSYEVDGKKLPTNFTNEVQVIEQQEAIQEVLKDKKIRSFVWNKLFKCELWQNSRFTEEKVFEDIDIMYRLFEKIDKIVLIDIDKYTYVQRADSIMHVRNSRYTLERLYVIVERYKNIEATKKEELKFANAYAFAVNFIVIYRSIILNHYDDIYEEFMKYYNMFIDIINKYEYEIKELLTSNQKIVLELIMEDINTAPQKIRAIKDIDK